MNRYGHVMRMLAETPWAMMPQKLALIAAVLERRSLGMELSVEDMRAAVGDRKPATSRTRRSVAVLPLYGVMFPKANLFTEMSGGVSLELWQKEFAAYAADDEISAILLDVDSPGGAIDLVPETAAMIREAREDKPILAVANTVAGSAAYWLASQASEVYASPSAMVGSIGVFTVHEDLTGQEEKMGIKTSLVSAGKYKTELSPYGPLSESAREALQTEVDFWYDMFVQDVARGRGIAVERVREGFGEGRMVSSFKAADEGMVDRVATLDMALDELARPSGVRADAVEAQTWAPVAEDATSWIVSSGVDVDVTAFGNDVAILPSAELPEEPVDELAGRRAARAAQLRREHGPLPLPIDAP